MALLTHDQRSFHFCAPFAERQLSGLLPCALLLAPPFWLAQEIEGFDTRACLRPPSAPDPGIYTPHMGIIEWKGWNHLFWPIQSGPSCWRIRFVESGGRLWEIFTKILDVQGHGDSGWEDEQLLQDLTLRGPQKGKPQGCNRPQSVSYKTCPRDKCAWDTEMTQIRQGVHCLRMGCNPMTRAVISIRKKPSRYS